MTPREKAGEIFDKYFNPLRKLTTDLNYQTYLFKEDLCIQHAKKCALIAVEEIKEAIFWHPYESPNFELEYWNEVKQEIEKL